MLEPRFSTNLGLDISVGSRAFFLYPSVDFLTFPYNQQIQDVNYLYNSQKSRASYTILTVAFGHRMSFGNLSFYPFAGIGGGLTSEPRVTVNESSHQAVLAGRRINTFSAKGGPLNTGFVSLCCLQKGAGFITTLRF